MMLGGMPQVVSLFVENKNYGGTHQIQQQIIRAYEEDIRKYARGLDQAKIARFYRNIAIFLGKDNKKY